MKKLNVNEMMNVNGGELILIGGYVDDLRGNVNVYYDTETKKTVEDERGWEEVDITAPRP